MQPYLVNVIGRPGLKCLPNISLRLTQPFKFLFSKDFNDFLSSFILPFTVNSFYSGHCRDYQDRELP